MTLCAIPTCSSTRILCSSPWVAPNQFNSAKEFCEFHSPHMQPGSPLPCSHCCRVWCTSSSFFWGFPAIFLLLAWTGALRCVWTMSHSWNYILRLFDPLHCKGGFPPSDYNSHSFRLAGFSFAFQIGIQAPVIKPRGDRKYQVYIWALHYHQWHNKHQVCPGPEHRSQLQGLVGVGSGWVDLGGYQRVHNSCISVSKKLASFSLPNTRLLVWLSMTSAKFNSFTLL